MSRTMGDFRTKDTIVSDIQIFIQAMNGNRGDVNVDGIFVRNPRTDTYRLYRWDDLSAQQLRTIRTAAKRNKPEEGLVVGFISYTPEPQAEEQTVRGLTIINQEFYIYYGFTESEGAPMDTLREVQKGRWNREGKGRGPRKES